MVRAVIQARMLSTRLRSKSLMAVAGKPLLVRVLERIKAMPFIDEVVVATTSELADEPIVATVKFLGFQCVQGDPNDLLRRFLQASEGLGDDDCILRFSADNPLYDPARSAKAYQIHRDRKMDYTHVDGLSHVVPEFIQLRALRRTAELTQLPYDREHVTPYLRTHPELFQIQTLPAEFEGLRPDLDPELTIDRPEQLEKSERMLQEIETPGKPVNLDDCYDWLDKDNARICGLTPQLPGQKRLRLAGREIGDGCPCFVIAEIGQNHNGQINLAKRLIDMAGQNDCQAVKFQKRDIQWELTEEAYNRPYVNPNSFGPTYGKHREFLELSEEQHLELRDYAMSQGLVYMCTSCDPPSVDAMERIGNPIYKVASRDITNIPLLRYMAKTNKPIILSTGMAGMQDIREALSAIGDHPAGVVLLQCISEYPAELTHINLLAMETLRKEFGLLVGLSDHTSGIITGVAASVMGACVVEKHITLSRAMPGTDHAGALEEEGLRRMVRYIRQCRQAMGDGKKEYDHVVDAARQKLARSLTSRMEIPAGTVLTEDMLIMKSPGTGLMWRDRDKIVGKKAKQDIAANVTLEVKMFN